MAAMTTCKGCGQEFKKRGKHYSKNRKYCLECQPFGCKSLDSNPKQIIKQCEKCGKDFLKYAIGYSPDRGCCLECVPQNKHRAEPTHCRECDCLLTEETSCKEKSGFKRSQCKKCRQRYNVERQRVAKQNMVNYKGGKCEICGYCKCLTALEFHHKNPNEKDFEVSHAGRILTSEILTELDKCSLVCANCHREIHDQIIRDN